MSNDEDAVQSDDGDALKNLQQKDLEIKKAAAKAGKSNYDYCVESCIADKVAQGGPDAFPDWGDEVSKCGVECREKFPKEIYVCRRVARLTPILKPAAGLAGYDFEHWWIYTPDYEGGLKGGFVEPKLEPCCGDYLKTKGSKRLVGVIKIVATEEQYDRFIRHLRKSSGTVAFDYAGPGKTCQDEVMVLLKACDLKLPEPPKPPKIEWKDTKQWQHGGKQ